MSQQSQRKLVLQRLLEKKTITSWEAITDFRCTRLSAVIFDLRQEGYNIDTKRMVNENNGKNNFRICLAGWLQTYSVVEK